jgi:hypothetical protein
MKTIPEINSSMKAFLMMVTFSLMVFMTYSAEKEVLEKTRRKLNGTSIENITENP